MRFLALIGGGFFIFGLFWISTGYSNLIGLGSILLIMGAICLFLFVRHHTGAKNVEMLQDGENESE